jgi:hypothetical protein
VGVSVRVKVGVSVRVKVGVSVRVKVRFKASVKSYQMYQKCWYPDIIYPY